MSACKFCGDEIVWVDRRPTDPKTSERHTCRGRVSDDLKRPTRHHVSQYRLRRYVECERRSYFADVLDLPDPLVSDEVAAGKLFASAVEWVTIERHKANALAKSIVVEDLHGALEEIVGRESWTPGALSLARSICVKAAPKLDLSFAVVDEHGPMVERAFELACGAGVLAGGVFDLVERVGDEIVVVDYKSGQYRDPKPATSPQVGLYLAQAHAMWPELNVRFALRYVALDIRDDEVLWSREIEDSAKALARAMVTKSRARRDDPRAWTPRVGSHCATCPFTARCDAYQARMKEKPPEGALPDTLEEVAAELHNIEPLEGIYSKRVKLLRERGKVLAGAVAGPSGKLLAGLFPVTLKTIERKGYTVEPTTYQVLEVGDPDPEALAALSKTVAHGIFAGLCTTPEEVVARLASEKADMLALAAKIAAIESQPVGVFPAGSVASEEAAEATRSGEEVAAASAVASPSHAPAEDPTPQAGAAATAIAEKPSAEAPAERDVAAVVVEAREALGSGSLPVEASGAPLVDSASPEKAPTPGVVGTPEELRAPRPVDAARATPETPREVAPDAGAPPAGPDDSEEDIEQRAADVIAEQRAIERETYAERITDPTPTPPSGSPTQSLAPVTLSVQDVLDRLGLAQVRHAGDLVEAPENEPATGVCSAILNLAAREHGEERVHALWVKVGGELTGGQRPRRKPLSGGALRRLVMALPPKFQQAPETPPIAQGQKAHAW